MVNKIFWLIGVGTPAFFLIYLGLFNLDVPLPDYSLGIELSFELSLFAIGFGVLASYGLFFHNTMRSLLHTTHCEITSFTEFFLIVGLIVFSLNVLFGFFIAPFGQSIEWITVIAIASIAGGVGVILYRIDMEKSLNPLSFFKK